ncbi:MAG TPA: class I SAM-dependent methyltransferase [Bryobacteraceae bacterium]|nr:class I SAM-dependent methyltransferase [Bryobacteraceae bacterium]
MDDLSYIRPPAALARILKRSAEIGFEMASEDRTGALLRTLAASKPGGRFLELGTGTGVATAWVLDGMDETSELFSIDINPDFQASANEALGQDGRLTLIAEDAVTFLKRQPAASFDFVFADAMRGKYEDLDDALRVVRLGGFYVIDDMLPQSNWPEGHAARVLALLETLAAHAEFEIAPMAWASGVVVAVRTGTSASATIPI